LRGGWTSFAISMAKSRISYRWPKGCYDEKEIGCLSPPWRYFSFEEFFRQLSSFFLAISVA